MNKADRVFVSLYSAVGVSWIDNAAREMTADDKVLLIEIGLGRPSSPKTVKLIDELKKNDIAKVVDCSELAASNDDEDLFKYLFEVIKKYADKDSNILFMGYEMAHKNLHEKLKEKVCPNVYTGKTLKNIKNEMRKKKNSDSKNSRNSRRLDASEEQADALVSALNKANSDRSDNSGNDTKENQQNEGSSSENKPEAPEKNGKPGADEEKGKKQGDAKPNKPNILKGVRRGNTDEDQESLRDIEKRIFIETKDEFHEEDEDDVSSGKGMMVALLFDRLKNSISKYIKSYDEIKDNLKEEDFLNIVIIILSCDNYTEFTENWNIAGNKKIKFGFNTESFGYIKEEAMYYNEVTETLFTHDKWS